MSLIEYATELDEQEEPQPLPANTYPATCEVSEERENKAGTGKYLALGWRISADNYPADFVDGNPDGILLFYNRVRTSSDPQARWDMKQLRKALGLSTRTKTIDPYEFIGITANIVTTVGEWEGKKRAEISRILGA